MGTLLDQLTSRDAALLTWAGVCFIALAWSMFRGGSVGRSSMDTARAFFTPKIVAMVVLVIGWQLVVVYGAAQVGLWDTGILKDTIVIVVLGGFVAGFKALELMDGKATWRGEVVALIGLVVIVQWLSNLQTFPYLVELALVPLAVLFGGMQALANHDDKYEDARWLFNGMVIVLGAGVVGWSIYMVATSLGATEWETVGRSFALAFWLPAALIPAIYVAALVMQYGKTFTVMKSVRPPSVGARVDFYLHHRLNLRRLSRFARTHGRVREYARAGSRAERLSVLRMPTV